jgi:sigma54-dependent transcription regulator
MSNAAITSALTRAAANSLVERAERQTGSRMAAYEMVAMTVGTSSEWLRKFIKGRDAKEPGWTAGWNILDQYNRICSRVEQENETERVKILALKGKIDAATAPFNRMVETTLDAEASPTRGK